MSFSSVSYLVFLTLVILIVLAVDKFIDLPKRRIVKHLILFIASYIFYGWWNWRFCFLMLLLTIISYFCSKEKSLLSKYSKLYYAIGVIAPLLVLGIFKYYNFFVSSFCDSFGMINNSIIAIILPVGISFYTFQSLSYTIDVHRGNVKPTSFLKLGLFIAFFPQLVAGPIVKANEFLPQLEEDRSVTIDRFKIGIQIFVFGLFKKVVLADQLSVFVDNVYGTPLVFNSFTVILAVISYSLQIYFDFSGYSDMAIGSAKMLGYDLPENFNLPYISKNISEFWKRWHISLSSWLFQYLYIPLGGNRKGEFRTKLNLMMTMILGGLWHGAAWTFVAWGTLHGVALVIQKGFSEKYKFKENYLTTVISIIVTYIFTSLCWVFFRAPSFSVAIDVFKKVFFYSDGVVQLYSWSFIGIILVLMASVIACLKANKNKTEIEGYYPIMDISEFKMLVMFFVFIGITLGLAYTGNKPFVYFQF